MCNRFNSLGMGWVLAWVVVLCQPAAAGLGGDEVKNRPSVPTISREHAASPKLQSPPPRIQAAQISELNQAQQLKRESLTAVNPAEPVNRLGGAEMTIRTHSAAAKGWAAGAGSAPRGAMDQVRPAPPASDARQFASRSATKPSGAPKHPEMSREFRVAVEKSPALSAPSARDVVNHLSPRDVESRGPKSDAGVPSHVAP